MDPDGRLATQLHDFDRSGWCRFLPWEGSFLWTVLCEATELDLDGDLDALVDWYRGVAPGAFEMGLFQGLDAIVDYGRGWLDQRRLESTFARTGHRYPRTAREVAQVGLALGVYRREGAPGAHRWRAPPILPLPTETLAMTVRQRRDEDHRRQHLLWSTPAHEIVDALHDMGCPESVEASISDVADLIGVEVATARHALAHLVTDGRLRSKSRGLVRICLPGPKRRKRAADPELLDADQRFVLTPRWRALTAVYGVTWELLHPGESWGPD